MFEHNRSSLQTGNFNKLLFKAHSSTDITKTKTLYGSSSATASSAAANAKDQVDGIGDGLKDMILRRHTSDQCFVCPVSPVTGFIKTWHHQRCDRAFPIHPNCFGTTSRSPWRNSCFCPDPRCTCKDITSLGVPFHLEHIHGIGAHGHELVHFPPQVCIINSTPFSGSPN